MVCHTNFNNRYCHILSIVYNYQIFSGFWQLKVFIWGFDNEQYNKRIKKNNPYDIAIFNYFVRE